MTLLDNGLEFDKRRRRRDGLRVYGAWAGNPDGVLEDTTRCVFGVWPDERAPVEHQCQRKRVAGPGGLWCRRHDPTFVETMRAHKARQAAKESEEDALMDARIRRALRRLGVKGGYAVSSSRTCRPSGYVGVPVGELERLADEKENGR